MKKRILIATLVLASVLAGCGNGGMVEQKPTSMEKNKVEATDNKTTSNNKMSKKDAAEENTGVKAVTYMDDVYEGYYLPKSNFFVLENNSMNLILADGSVFDNLEMFGMDDSLGNKQKEYFYKFDQEKDLSGVTVGFNDKYEITVSDELSVEEVVAAASSLNAKDGLTPAVYESTPSDVEISDHIEYRTWDQSENDELVMSFQEKSYYGSKFQKKTIRPVDYVQLTVSEDSLAYVERLPISKINGIDLEYVEDIQYKYDDGIRNETCHEREDYFKSVVDVLGRPKYEYVWTTFTTSDCISSPSYIIRYYWQVDNDTYISAELEAWRKFLTYNTDSNVYICGNSSCKMENTEYVMDHVEWNMGDIKIIKNPSQPSGHGIDFLLNFVLAVEDMGYGNDNEFFNRK